MAWSDEGRGKRVEQRAKTECKSEYANSSPLAVHLCAVASLREGGAEVVIATYGGCVWLMQMHGAREDGPQVDGLEEWIRVVLTTK